MPLDLRCWRDAEVDPILRITREDESPSRLTLRLEGSVVANWAVLLEHECSRLLRDGRVVSLDLAGVHFVDRSGVETLGRLSHAGVDIHCRPGPVANVLEGEGIRVTRDADDEDDGPR